MSSFHWSRRQSVDRTRRDSKGFKGLLSRAISHDPWHFPAWSRKVRGSKEQSMPLPSFAAIMEDRHLAALRSHRHASSSPVEPRSHGSQDSTVTCVSSRQAPDPTFQDRKWIPPTLPGGSLSTSALGTYSQGNEESISVNTSGRGSDNRRARKSSLAVLFTSSAFTTYSIDEEDSKHAPPEIVSGLPNGSALPPFHVGHSTRHASSDSASSYLPSIRIPPLLSPSIPPRVSSMFPSSGRARQASWQDDEARDDSEEEPCDQVRARRMSEQTLQDARLRIIGRLSQYGGSLDHLPASTLRGDPISQSLAALEGKSAPQWHFGNTPKRAVPIRSHSVASTHGALDDQEESMPPSGSALFRRTSSSGKIVVPKRAISPAPPSNGYPSIALPISPTVSSPLAPPPIIRSQTSSGFTDCPQLTLERRQSEGYPPQYSRPAHFKLQSMVNLSMGSPLDSLSRGQSRESADFGEGPQLVRYQIGNCVGRGQFGAVYRCLNLANGQMVAIKRIRLAGMKEREIGEVMREVELLQRLDHPSIVKYEGMSRDDEFLNIVLEFVENGSLGQTLKAFGTFNEKLVASYVWKILEGLHYLHSSGVVHCDLKAANILSTKNGNVKLSDFGVSLNLKAMENIKAEATLSSRRTFKDVLSEVAGTPNWMAPEVISLMGASPASDIWSLGCTIIELLTGKPPYADITNNMSVLFRIVEDDMPPLPPASPELADFLRLCFTKNQKHRPTAEQLFGHPWLTSHGMQQKCTVPNLLQRPLPRSSSLTAALPPDSQSPFKVSPQPSARRTSLVSWGAKMSPGAVAEKRRSLQFRLLRGFKLKRN